MARAGCLVFLQEDEAVWEAEFVEAFFEEHGLRGGAVAGEGVDVEFGHLAHAVEGGVDLSGAELAWGGDHGEEWVRNWSEDSIHGSGELACGAHVET